jgi:hypothetical protein
MGFAKKIRADSDTGNESEEPDEQFQPIEYEKKWPYKDNIYLHLKESKPENFLKKVAINIQVDDLYSIEEVCYLDPKFELLGLLLKVKNSVLQNQGFDGKKFVLQIWNKKCVKVYQKELFRRPQMWSSNAFLVFKPDMDEMQGPADDSSEGDSDAQSFEGG